MGLDEFVMMRLFAEVEVRAQCVLAEMHDQVTDQHQEPGARSAQRERLRDHLDERSGQHESGPESDEILQRLLFPRTGTITAPPKMFAAAAVRPSRMLRVTGFMNAEE